MPVISPSNSVENRTPTSSGFPSPASVSPGTADGDQMVHGQSCPLTGRLTEVGAERFPLSSTARLISVTAPSVEGLTLYVQFSLPAAGCHVAPPSMETSTPPTTPPPWSVAVPDMVVGTPACNPPDTVLTVVTGGVVSVDFVAGTSPGCNVPGCTPISANRLTVACCMFRSGKVPLMVVPSELSWLS